MSAGNEEQCLGTAPERRPARRIRVGTVAVGGDAPISVQSMTNTSTADAAATLGQIHRLAEAGCEIVRVGVPDEKSAKALRKIKAGSGIPVVADVHFSKKLALMSLDAGADGLRINPGNIGGGKERGEVMRAARKAGAALRIGVNAGSLEKDLLKKYGHPTAEAMVESALRAVSAAERWGVENLKVSLKASDVMTTVEAYRRLAGVVDWPLHIGITEAGAGRRGIVKSAAGLAILLAEGIGDTLRVSLTGDPVEEVRVGWELLGALGIRRRGPDIVACPTCARCGVDLEGVLRKVERAMKKIQSPIKVAVMGCVVNGPGEAREADAGVAAGRGNALIFRGGEIIKKVGEKEIVRELMKVVREIERERINEAGI
ncbi:MAG: flavodoxin-dependent (E)-4-hydroxy-3-methylbut-2-enyl-diphosphate synthase [bacterium]